MAARSSIDDRLREVQRLRQETDPALLQKGVSRALKDRANLVVADAAKIVRELELIGFETELLEAWKRMLVNPVKADPGCSAKTAIIEALGQLEYDEPDFYLKGIRYEQQEPAWGGSEDTAVNVRGASAFAIARSRWMGIVPRLTTLVNLALHFGNSRSRVFAAQAMADTRREEAIPILRLMLGLSESNSEVMGACMTGLLALAPQDYVPLVAAYLDSETEDVVLEAAAALGTCSRPEAVAALIAAWNRGADPELQESLLISMGLSREPAGFDFLTSLIKSNTRDSEIDLNAMKQLCVYPDLCQKVRDAVLQSRSPLLQGLFERRYGK
ncbi:MAG: hypothetical protein JWM11_7402 [Planctomycetaceae bacterium]|nr:hypothetical protein [Planctomycetaceae bacterium]